MVIELKHYLAVIKEVINIGRENLDCVKQNVKRKDRVL